MPRKTRIPTPIHAGGGLHLRPGRGGTPGHCSGGEMFTRRLTPWGAFYEHDGDTETKEMHTSEPTRPPLKPQKLILKYKSRKANTLRLQVLGTRCKASSPALENTDFATDSSRAEGWKDSSERITRNLSSFSSQRWSSSISCCCRISRSSIRCVGSACPIPRRSSAAGS